MEIIMITLKLLTHN